MPEVPPVVPPPARAGVDAGVSGFASSEELDTEEIPATDIVFECPHCSKSLSIDPRGAGLVIRCTQCGEPVTVPIPEGMEIEDFDATPEELSALLLQTRQALAKAQKRAASAETALESARLREKSWMEAAAPFRAAMAKAVRESESALVSLREAAAMAAGAFAPKGAAPESNAGE